MKKNKLIMIIVSSIIVVIALVNVLYLNKANEIGLTKSDLIIGEFPNVEVLLEKSTIAADSHLKQFSTEPLDICNGQCELDVNLNLISKINTYGYKSSFYYSSWNIFLPYSLKNKTDNEYIFIVQVGDGNGNLNDSNNKFRVIRLIIIDDKGKVVEQIDN